MGGQERQREELNQLKQQKMKSLNPLIQLNKQLHYLFIALLFASFAVAQSVQAASDKMIVFDYTTDPILCSLLEQVELHGKVRVSFKTKGKNVRIVSASLENFQGVGLTTRREYVADRVTIQLPDFSHFPILRLLYPTDMLTAAIIIPVVGKHPTDLNSATGDPLPGQDVHFQLTYIIGWKSRNGKIVQFIPDLEIPDGKGIISCN